MFRKLTRKPLLAGAMLLAAAGLSAGHAAAAGASRKAPPARYEKTRTAAPDYTQNLLARCQRFNGEQRSLCEQQIMDGPMQGSVKGGGVLYAPTVIETVPANL